ncbi:seven-hairpin glycosidase [Lentinus tigrinus ALCF2SS1-7]|uniref:alpha-1,2-Mannosidase n=1 Tax=Lentinus tigrinus ALCF2SS1-6 TaxID=1328759 RepID=A0A5C2S5H3_9APHY|nr:seven-hairpin glycosidase [Lentinus tigrinus ALCF2SS1-6]RPD73407.1 seven-hairpin glycosidase [Lentinus tigrinus ALCF2SS1-7]
MASYQSVLSRFRSARYITAAVAAVFVVSTLYYIQIPAGHPPSDRFSSWNDPPRPWQRPITPSSPVWDARAAQVKQAYLHAYEGYLKYAEGYDELRPLSNTGINNFNGWNVTMYDSLDTMLLMDLHDEFSAALPIISKGNFRKIKNYKFPGATKLYVPFFETVIRYLGGLLAAHALSGEQLLLDKADELGTLLEPAFNTYKGFPVFAIDTNSTELAGGISGILAEIASCQLEWTYLAHTTGSKKHFRYGNQVIQSLVETMIERQGGMFPTNWNLQNGRPGGRDTLSVGAAADSAHEYLLKQYLMTGQKDTANLEMYLLSTNEMLTRLMYVTPNRQMLYITDTNGPKHMPSHVFEHLSCFFPGLLALGAHTLPLNLSIIDPSGLNPDAQRAYRLLENYDLRELHMAAAEGLATSCWLMYADMPTGLGPEIANMEPKSRPWIDVLEEWRRGGMRGPIPGLAATTPMPYTKPEQSKATSKPWDYVVRRTDYFLRPETLESIYIMWRVTGDPVWRERGWGIFQAIEKHTKTPSGYASLRSVVRVPAVQQDEQPSYFLAETLKYLYLLFIDEDPVPLDQWVFNTEAHPFPIFEWSNYEKFKFDIPSSRVRN